jgi:hypothetical protein
LLEISAKFSTSTASPPSPRFFFKTRCDDDDNPIIQEEISNDTDVLPLFEGKVMATVKSVN